MDNMVTNYYNCPALNHPWISLETKQISQYFLSAFFLSAKNPVKCSPSLQYLIPSELYGECFDIMIMFFFFLKKKTY